jgi:NADPH:quinone reductase-like Zn-dependent oxidoreductase
MLRLTRRIGTNELEDDYRPSRNPADHDHRKHIDIPILATPGVTVGCDFVGTVVALGPKVTKDYKVGDRIAGCTHGCNKTEPEDGAFGEYCMVKEGISFKVPEKMPDAKAATVGVAVTTVALGLYGKLGMPMPGSGKTGEGQWLLVYGGSTATGSVAIQSAVLSGYKVLATCSPRNFDVSCLDTMQRPSNDTDIPPRSSSNRSVLRRSSITTTQTAARR